MARKLAAILAAATLAALCLGCEEGPAEKAGKKIDKFGRDVKEKAGDLVDSAKDKTGDLLDSAREKLSK